jgi:hypothetical protein
MLDAWDVIRGRMSLASETVPARVGAVEKAVSDYAAITQSPEVQYATATLVELAALDEAAKAHNDRLAAVRHARDAGWTLTEIADAINEYGFRLNKNSVKYLCDKPPK